MKLRTKLLSVAMAAAMCVPLAALTACNGGNDGPPPRDIPFEISAERKAQMDAESGTIRVIFPGLDRAADEWRNKGVARFEQQTGKKVEYIPTTFDTDEVTAFFRLENLENPLKLEDKKCWKFFVFLWRVSIF